MVDCNNNNEVCEELQAYLVDDTDYPQDVGNGEVLPFYKFAIDDWLKKIKIADSDALKNKIPKEISGLPITVPAQDRAVLIKAYQDRYKVLFDARISKPDVVSLLIKKKPMQIKQKKGAWYQDWLWITEQSKFFCKKKKCLVTKDSFNIQCGHYVPEGENGSKPSAVKFVSDHGLVECVDGMIYLPSCNDLIFTMDGKRLVNTFCADTCLPPASGYCEGGAEAMRRIETHIDLLFGNKENADIFIQWLAWQVQRKGEKILWAPLIQSPEGLGKSFFGSLLEKMLGYENVGIVGPEQVNSGNNGWAANKCVNVLEELRVQGKNRYEVANALKPLITNPTIQISDKYIVSYNTRNVANYIAFTNYKDVLPLTEHDRRWWVICTPIQSMAEFREKTDKDDFYFQKLFDGLNEYPEQVLKYFLDVTITAEFENMKMAPITQDKRSMILSEKAAIEGLVEVEELMEAGGEFYNQEVVSSADIFNALADQDIHLNRYEKNNILKKIGLQKHPKRIKVGSIAKWFWTMRQMEAQEIRKSLGIAL